jgi:hypothetical protein
MYLGERDHRRERRRKNGGWYGPKSVRFPDTYQTLTSVSLSWDLLCEEVEEPLLDQNPFVDQIRFMPEVAICHRLPREADPPEPSRVKPAMGWEEYTRRQAASRALLYARKKAQQALTGNGFTLQPRTKAKATEP